MPLQLAALVSAIALTSACGDDPNFGLGSGESGGDESAAGGSETTGDDAGADTLSIPSLDDGEAGEDSQHEDDGAEGEDVDEDGVIRFEDDFEDEHLDHRWQWRAGETTKAWTEELSASKLNIMDIEPTRIQSGDGGSWSRVRLERPLPACGDFHVEAELHWDSLATVTAMHQVIVSVMGKYGEELAYIGPGDAWVGYSGRARANIDGEETQRPKDTLALRGYVPVELQREGEELVVRWNGETFATGILDEPIYGVSVQFMFYPYDGPAGISTPGELAVDYISVEAVPLGDPPA